MTRWLVVVAVLATGCYRYTFEQRARAPGEQVVTHVERRPTWFNGFVGRGEVYTQKFCAHPIRTELKVNASDVLLSAVTLLIYTPHTLYVTCPEREDVTRR